MKKKKKMMRNSSKKKSASPNVKRRFHTLKKAGKHLYIGKRSTEFKRVSSNKLGTLAIFIVLLALFLQFLQMR